MNVGPMGQGSNPAINTPYDQISPASGFDGLLNNLERKNILEMNTGDVMNTPYQQKGTFDAQTAVDVDAAKLKNELRLKREDEKIRAEAEKIEGHTSSKNSFLSFVDQHNTIDSQIDKAIEQTGYFSSGYIGDKTKDMGGTYAADLKATLSTIQADAAFDRLQQMRNESKTGGALGQVSERELSLLMNARAALEQSQSPGQLKENLKRYQSVRRNALERVSNAFEKDYGYIPAPQKAPEQVGGVSEGQTATNPNTGEKMIYRGGKWQKI
jgi:hypothetical protein